MSSSIETKRPFPFPCLKKLSREIATAKMSDDQFFDAHARACQSNSNSSSYYDEERGLLDVLSAGASMLDTANALPPEDGNSGIESGVEHAVAERTMVFTSKDLMSSPQTKSRVAALEFRGIAVDHSVFALSVYEKIQLNYQAVTFGYGLPVRFYTFFAERQSIWVVVCAAGPIPFKKWHKVFVGLKPAEIVVPRYFREDRVAARESLLVVADIFSHLTTTEELVQNRVDCELDRDERAGRRSASSRSKRIRDASGTDEEKEGDAGKKTKRANRGKKRAAANDSAVLSARVVSEVFVYSSKQLRDTCMAFLQSIAIPEPQEMRDMFIRFIDSSRDPNYGHIGRFILSTTPLELFARVAELRRAVHHVLESNYGVVVGSLDNRAVVSSAGYKNIGSASKERLHRIGGLFDCDGSFPQFWLVDPTCILGFLCLYVAEQYERETTDKAQKEKDFLNSFLSPVLEQVWWYNAAVCRMSNFLFVQAAEGQSIPYWSIRLLFERHVDEQTVLLEQLRAYPSMAKIVRENPTREYMLGRRSSYWRTRLSSMVGRAKRACGAERLGLLGEILVVIQDNTRACYEMQCSHPAYSCLPPTCFAQEPSAHAQGFGTPVRLVEHICKDRRSC